MTPEHLPPYTSVYGKYTDLWLFIPSLLEFLLKSGLSFCRSPVIGSRIYTESEGCVRSLVFLFTED